MICLDILRALQKEPATADALLDELRRAKEFALELDKEIPNSYNKTLEEVRVRKNEFSKHLSREGS